MGIEDFIKSDDLSFQKILNNLLDGKQNLALKTEIHAPKELAGLELYAMVIQDKYPRSSKRILQFIRFFRENMVSYLRKSRDETVKALTHHLEEERKEQLREVR